MELPEDERLREALDAFRLRLASGDNALTLVREFVTHGSSVVLTDSTYTKLRELAGAALSLSPNQDVLIVGSAKLGFSIKPKRRFELFGDDSDVDIAIVSSNLYETLWEEARHFTRSAGLWESDSKIHFKNDHFRGVIKPYVMPDSDAIPTRRRLFDLESELQRVGGSPFPVTIAVWHSIEALEDYQLIAMEQCLKEQRL